MKRIDGSSVAVARRQRRISQLRLAHALGVDQATISDLERNMIPAIEEIISEIEGMEVGPRPGPKRRNETALEVA